MGTALFAAPAVADRRAPDLQSACTGSEVLPATVSRPALRATILCLHNEVRAANGLPLLRESARLRRAGVAHSADMVTHAYFAHNALSGATLTDRLRRVGYVRNSVRWTIGENLAWGSGSLSTPGAVMRAWLGSAGHRANLLRRSFRELGIGVAAGMPSDAGSGATYTADFGVRR